MEQIMNYVKPELLVLAAVLYFVGVAMKKAEMIADKYIPVTLGALGILLCPLGGMQEIAMAVFTAIVQGILVAGLSTYVNQIIKQHSKEE